MRKLYLAGHFKQDGYRTEATERLSPHYAILDPFRPEHDLRGKEEGASNTIVKWDLEDIVDCDLVLANFTDMSVGTSMECWFAHSIGRPVFSFVEGNEIRVSPWTEYISDRPCMTSRDDAIRTVEWLDWED